MGYLADKSLQTQCFTLIFTRYKKNLQTSFQKKHVRKKGIRNLRLHTTITFDMFSWLEKQIKRNLLKELENQYII